MWKLWVGSREHPLHWRPNSPQLPYIYQTPTMHEVVPANADYDHGGPKHRGSRLDGEMHGVWEFFRRDGSLMRSVEFDSGKQVGMWRTFDRSGTVVSETEFPPPEVTGH